MVIERPNRDTVIVKLTGSVIFSSLLQLKKRLAALEPGKTVVFDLSDSYRIDHTVMEFIHDYMHSYEAQGGHCQQIGQ